MTGGYGEQPAAAAGTEPARRVRAHDEQAPGLGGLFLAEAHRFAARRFVRWLLAVALVGYLGIVTLVGLTLFGRTTDADVAQARQEIARIVAEQNDFRQRCLASPVPPGSPEGATPQDVCPPADDVSNYRVEDFLPHRPFSVANHLPAGSLAVGSAVAAMLFIVGATWVGAEWSARTMMALLFWEPRRLRVLAVKAAVLVLAAAAVAALAQVLWIGTAHVLQATRGSAVPLPEGFWPDVAAQGGRTVALGVLVALLGTALAHLIRGTGAALGIGFVYFAVVESALAAVRPGLQPWLLSTNAGALVTKGGVTLQLPGRGVDPQSGQVVDFVNRHLSNLHGALVLGGVAAALLVLGGWVFRRRDLT